MVRSRRHTNPSSFGPSNATVSGTELLEVKLQQRLRLLLGIGVKAEAVAEATRFKRVLSRVDYIWDRDEFSKELLVGKFDVNENRVTILLISLIRPWKLSLTALKQRDLSASHSICISKREVGHPFGSQSLS